MTVNITDLQDFKVMYLDFSGLPSVCWITRVPSLSEPDLCRVGTYPRDHFLQAIVSSEDTYVVARRFKLADIMDLNGLTINNFLAASIVFQSPTGESYVIDDFDSKVTLHMLYAEQPDLYICVLELVLDTYEEDYDRAMRIVV